MLSTSRPPVGSGWRVEVNWLSPGPLRPQGLCYGGRLAPDELDEQGATRLAHLEVGRIQALHQRRIVGQANEMVRNADKGPQVITQCARTFALLEKGIERRGPDAPRLTRLETLQASLPAPSMHGRRLHPEPFGDVLNPEEFLIALRILAHGCRRRGARSAHQYRLRL